MTEATVHLVRHGEVENPRCLRYGCLPGFALSPRGRAQAESTGLHLRGLDAPVSVLVSSPLERAVETADILREVLGYTAPVRVDPRLVEAASRYDGLRRGRDPLGHIARVFDAELPRESASDVARRMYSALLDLTRDLPPGAVLVVVSHQLPIVYARSAFERALGRPEASLFTRIDPWGSPTVRCDHASVTTRALRGTRGDVRSYWSP